MKKLLSLLTISLVIPLALRAELKLPAIIGDHMVLQQNQANPIWGWDTPGTNVTVSFAGQSYSATAGADGRWTVKLAPLPANATPQTLTVMGSTQRELQDVLIGEVWMCSGQSNMEWGLGQATNGDIEAAASQLPNLRLITVPNVGTQELQDNFKGEWAASTPESARKFSAVGFLYGRYLHEILNVPVGLIDNSWGGSTAEAWVRRTTLEQDPRFQPLMAVAVKREADIASGKAQLEYEQAMTPRISMRVKLPGRPVAAGTFFPDDSPEIHSSGECRMAKNLTRGHPLHRGTFDTTAVFGLILFPEENPGKSKALFRRGGSRNSTVSRQNVIGEDLSINRQCRRRGGCGIGQLDRIRQLSKTIERDPRQFSLADRAAVQIDVAIGVNRHAQPAMIV